MSYVKIFIPPELSPMVKDLTRFWSAMVYKLRKNAHKGKWEDVDLTKGFSLLTGEVEELRLAIEEGSYAEVMLEGADAANMAMIITSVALNSLPLPENYIQDEEPPPLATERVSVAPKTAGATSAAYKVSGYPEPKGKGVL
jgi:hypothetical protein